MLDISFRPSDGTLFAWNAPSLNRPVKFGGLSTINLGTGAATLIDHATGVLADDGSALAFSPSDQLFYAGSEDPGGTTCTNGWGTLDCDDVLHIVDTMTAAASLHTTMTFPPAPAGVHDDGTPRISDMDFHPETGVLFASIKYGFGSTASSFLGTLDPGTGVVTLIGPMARGIDGLAFTDLPDVKDRDDVAIAFPPGSGFWTRLNDTTWFPLHGTSPVALATGNLDRSAAEFDPIPLAPVAAPAQIAFKGIGTRVRSIGAPAEGASISATFDNVRVNGVPYDDFGLTRIDRDKWANLEFVRMVEGGQLKSELTRFGANGSNTLNLLDPDSVNSLQAQITVTDVENTAAGPRARLAGFFYNDGTPGGGQTGEIQADIAISHNGSNLEVGFFVGRCEDSDCNSFTTFLFDNTSLGPVGLGETHTLSIAFDSTTTTFTFGFDVSMVQVTTPVIPAFSLPSQFFTRTGSRFKGVGVRVSGINGPEEGAFISARFDDVQVNGTPFDDFASGTIDGSKWVNLEFVRAVEGPQLKSELTRFGSNGSNNMNFVDTGRRCGAGRCAE